MNILPQNQACQGMGEVIGGENCGFAKRAVVPFLTSTNFEVKPHFRAAMPTEPIKTRIVL